MKESSQPLPVEAVLEEELRHVVLSRALRTGAEESAVPKPDAHQLKLFGLAFSGGGIRSATFNLGVLQALETAGILKKLDYLSTVSGGGYIGSWYLTCLRHNLSAHSEAAIEHLRHYSRYLAPQAGLFSADTWTLLAIWFRNSLLLQVALACFLACLLLVPRILHQAFKFTPKWLMATLAFLPLALGIIRICMELRRRLNSRGNLPDDHYDAVDQPVTMAGFASADTLPRVQTWIVLPLIISGFFGSALIWHGKSDLEALLPFLGILIVNLTWILGMYSIRHAFKKGPLWRDQVTLVSIACGALFIGLTILLGDQFENWKRDTCHHQAIWHAAILGVPGFLVNCALVIILQIGLFGNLMSEALREWWSRLAAFLGIYSTGLLALGAFSIYGPLLVAKVWGWSVAALSAGGALTTVAGFLAGWSHDTGQEKSAPGGRVDVLKDFIARVAPYVFVLGLILIVSLGLHLATVAGEMKANSATPFWNQPCPIPGQNGEWVNLSLGPFQNVATPDQFAQFHWSMLSFVTDQHPTWPFITFILCAIVTLILTWRVDINQFSMNMFYRNRLVRCYLGAARRATGKRRADLFTGFDFEDDYPLAQLSAGTGGGSSPFSGPLPLINTALNAQGGNNAGLEERRAFSFTLTPHYCGSPQTGYSMTSAWMRKEGIRVGSAVAISGAAASPNSGFHTSAPVAFLMTFFNVRLGWWVANPAGTRTTKNPAWGLWYLLKELFALAGIQDDYVYLSDGGHFENLGVYELVRRRCSFIIASDAEQDNNYNFEGLGGLIRKCRIDFGTEIQIDVSRIAKAEGGFNHTHWALGQICYPGGSTGQLLYLKASLTGDEPVDVQQYKKSHLEFPQESTGNQFYTESQFESYRALGYHVAHVALSQVQSEQNSPKDAPWIFKCR